MITVDFLFMAQSYHRFEFGDGDVNYYLARDGEAVVVKVENGEMLEGETNTNIISQLHGGEEIPKQEVPTEVLEELERSYSEIIG